MRWWKKSLKVIPFSVQNLKDWTSSISNSKSRISWSHNAQREHNGQELYILKFWVLIPHELIKCHSEIQLPIWRWYFCNLTEIASFAKSPRDHPFKTSAFLRGGGVKNLQNWPMDSSKKLPTGGGRDQKSWKICRSLKWIVPNATFSRNRKGPSVCLKKGHCI